MAIIGDALRQAFMPKHEYECLRDEDKAWGKLQRPLIVSLMALISLTVIICTVISLNIVFPASNGKRPFCSDERLQPLIINNVKGRGDSDHFPGAYYLTDQETVDYYWMVVFLPSIIIFFVSLVYLVAGKQKVPTFCLSFIFHFSYLNWVCLGHLLYPNFTTNLFQRNLNRNVVYLFSIFRIFAIVCVVNLQVFFLGEERKIVGFAEVYTLVMLCKEQNFITS
jgi:hypothetical protein